MDRGNNQWFDCERGSLDSVISELKRTNHKTTRRHVLRLFGAIALTGSGVFFLNRYRRNVINRPLVPQIDCATVHQNLVAFVNEEITDRHLLGLVSRHLFVCPGCQKAYRGLINDADFDCGADPQA